MLQLHGMYVVPIAFGSRYFLIIIYFNGNLRNNSDGYWWIFGGIGYYCHGNTIG